jgi:MFS family permease
MNFKLLKNRTYALFIFGSIITLMGDTFLDFGLALYVLHITGSAAKYSFVIAIAAFPSIILGPISGSLVDRFDKKKLLILFDLFRGVLLTMLTVFTYGRGISLIEIYVIAFVFGICSSVYRPCVNTVIPSIVEGKDLVGANTLYMMLLQLGLIIAPTIAVIIYQSKGISSIIIFDAITFFIMAFVAVFYKLKRSSTNDNGSIVENIKDGFRLFKDKEILALCLNGTFSYLLVIPLFAVGLPFIVKDIFNGTDNNYATIQTMISVSAIGIIVTVPIISKKMKDLKALNFTMYGMLVGICTMLLLINHSFFNYIKSNNLRMVIFLVLVSFIFYLSFATYGIFFQTINQRKINNKFFGRYYSVLLMMFGIGSVLGNAIFGFLYDTKVILYPVILAITGMILKILLNKMITPIEEPVNVVNQKVDENNYEV